MTTSTVPGGLQKLADALEDLEGERKSQSNRYGVMIRPVDKLDEDGRARGLGLSDLDLSTLLVKRLIEHYGAAEKEVVAGLEKVVRGTIYGPWVADQKGIGAKTIGRLLGCIGDPYINEQTGQPRTLRQLWAYSGLAVDNGVARRPRKGATQEEVFASGKSAARMRAWNCVQPLIKNGHGGKFRAIYEEDKALSVGAVHSVDCVRCGPSGKPALAGSPLSDGHRNARAIRKVSKEILRDLWLIARAHHAPELTS